MRGGVAWSEMIVESVLIEILARNPLGSSHAPVRARAFFVFWGCFRVWRDMGRGEGLG